LPESHAVEGVMMDGDLRTENSCKKKAFFAWSLSALTQLSGEIQLPASCERLSGGTVERLRRRQHAGQGGRMLSGDAGCRFHDRCQTWRSHAASTAYPWTGPRWTYLKVNPITAGGNDPLKGQL
jgi:hypothetical protein